MPELPEVQAHAERLSDAFTGAVLRRFVPITFTALKTAVPPPDSAYGQPLLGVGRRGKYLLVRFAPTTFVIHLMQGGRLLVDAKQSPKPRGGQARFVFDDGRALLLTEAGTERRAGVWCVPTSALSRATVAGGAAAAATGTAAAAAAAAAAAPDPLPLGKLGPEADQLDATAMAERFAAFPMRLHGFLRDQHAVAGLGRRLANEVCHRAKLSPFANTAKLGAAGAATVVAAIRIAVDEGLAYERTRPDMSSSADRPGGVHKRTGEPCGVCGDTIREVQYSSYTVSYCPTCQTNGKVLADNTTSRFLK